MRVALDASPLDQPWATGVEKSFLTLLHALAELPGDHEFLLVAPRRPRLLPELPAPRFRECFLADRGPVTLWRERLVPAFAHRERIDLWHSPVQAIPLLLDRPKVATMHEISWAETSGVRDEGPVAVRRMHALVVARAADRIVCVSARTRRNFLNLHPAAEPRCVVVHHGVDAARFQAAPDRAGLAQRYGIPVEPPYLLTVGRALKRKGLPRALRAYRVFLDRSAAPHQLVLAGPPTPQLEEARAQAERLGLGARVHFPGWIQEEDLPALYAGASAFLFPSESEGFGLPLLEAMAAGTPVVASDAASIPEVAGGAACLADFEMPLAAADALRRVLGPERADWVERGRVRAAEFPPERQARRLLELWQELRG